MNRREFIGALVGAAAGMAIDPERALWVPRAKLISIPQFRPVEMRFMVHQNAIRDAYALFIKDWPAIRIALGRNIFADMEVK